MHTLQVMRQQEETALNCAMPRLAAPHPNEFDLRRIRHLLEQRVRYRYVTPEVRPDAEGYLVVSPCCSRNVDSSGGIIDIARIEYVQAQGLWQLFHKDHRQAAWKLYSSATTLHELMVSLNDDPLRVFWQ